MKILGLICFILLVSQWLCFLIKPYYIAWDIGAELVSETFWPTGALRNPVVNGKSLVYLQNMSDDEVELREILASGEFNDYSISVKDYRNYSMSYFSQDLTLQQPIIFISGEAANDSSTFLYSVHKLGQTTPVVLENSYDLDRIIGVTRDYILAQPVFNEGKKLVNHPVILNWELGRIKTLPIFDEGTEALFIDTNYVYYSKNNILYKITNSDLTVSKLVKFPEQTNDDNWILMTTDMKMIWRSFNDGGANFFVYDLKSNEHYTIAEGLQRWVTEYSLSAGNVIFSSAMDENSDLDIFSVNIASGVVKRLLAASGAQHSPHLHGDYLYWEETLSNPLEVIVVFLNYLGISNWESNHSRAKVSEQSYVFRKKNTYKSK